MELNDKIKGALYGFALGDALGLGTEFMTKNEVESYYPEGLRHFSQIIRDAHRCQWEHGEWTNDTEILVRLLESVIECGGFDLRHIVRTLAEWCRENPMDLIPAFRVILKNPDWEEHPIAVAHHAWQDLGINEASNESIHRGLITGMTSGREKMNEHTRKIVLLSHDDTRCVSTATIVARMTYSLLWDEKEADYEDLKRICHNVDTRTIPYLEKAYYGSLEDLDLDDEDTLAYTRKCMASALWALWHCDNAEDMFNLIIDEGGDADSNAALAGAFAGLKYGYDAIPEEKKNLVRFDYIGDLADRLTEFIEKKGRD